MKEEHILFIVIGAMALIAVVMLVGRRERYGNAMGKTFVPFDLEGQKEMCRIILQDPDMKGSGLTEINCDQMPLTAFNEAMRRTYVCKKNFCGVVGSPSPDKKECVKGCKQAAYASSLYSSYGYSRRNSY
jgi:hypothetical protein